MIIITIIVMSVFLIEEMFLRFCLKVFKLSAFISDSGTWLQDEGPMKEKAFWHGLVFRQGRLRLKKLFHKLTLPSSAT